jgi:SsrA-binding protein
VNVESSVIASGGNVAESGVMAGKKEPQDDNNRVVCRNRRASHEYDLQEHLECGLMLHGSEVKSIRAGKVSIEEAYVRVADNEVWLIGCDIAEYPQASYLNHDPRRMRKLLMHRREVHKFAAVASQKGLTIVPIELAFKGGFVKLTVAVARGRKLHDKREALKKQDADREMRQAIRNVRKS